MVQLGAGLSHFVLKSRKPVGHIEPGAVRLADYFRDFMLQRVERRVPMTVRAIA